MRRYRFLLLLLPLLTTATAFAHGISDADQQAMLDGGYFRYVTLGASHMLTGYDHLLFLFGVMFFLTKFKDIVKFITAFTLGHTITLISATFMGITANYFLVDAVIALTVIYKGFDNVDGFRKYLNMKSPNLVLLVFIFGLIHGFGLSTRLQQLPLGDDGLLLRILSFNVGVELGQIVALAIMLSVLTIWRRRESFQQFSMAANVGLMVVGGLLFLMQMHGYMHEAEGLESTAKVAVIDQSAVPWSQPIELTIPADGSREYKLYMVKGTTMEYTWTTKGAKLYFDFHGEPSGDTTGAFESFKKATSTQDTDSVSAPFDGTIGWYWRNRSKEPVTLQLRVKGQYILMDNRSKEELRRLIKEQKAQLR